MSEHNESSGAFGAIATRTSRRGPSASPPSLGFKLALCVLVAVAAGFVLTPDNARKATLLGSEDIGRPSPLTIRAPKDLKVDDAESTSQKRRQALQSVSDVFDYHERRPGEQTPRLKQALALVEQRQVAWLQERDDKARSANPTPPDPQETSAARLENLRQQRDDMIGYLKKERPADFDELTAAVMPLRAQFNDALGVVISKGDWMELVKGGLPEEWQKYLLGALEEVARKPIVTAQDWQLIAKADRISVRRYRDHDTFSEEVWKEPNKLVIQQRDIPKVLYAFSKNAGKGLSSASINLAHRLIAELMHPTMQHQAKITSARRSEIGHTVRPVQSSIKRGEVIIRAGDMVTPTHIHVLKGLTAQYANEPVWLRVIGMALLFLTLLLMLHRYGAASIRKYAPQRRDLSFMAICFVMSLLLLKLFSWNIMGVMERFLHAPVNAALYLAPLPAAAMMVRIVLNAETAYLFIVMQSVAAGLAFDNTLTGALYVLATSLMAAHSVAPLHSRLSLIWAGVRAGGIGAVIIGVLSLGQGDAFQVSTPVAMGMALAGGVLSSLLTGMLIPVFESMFKYTTDLKLLRLINLNHPMLKQLLVQAPGTHHHSMMVARLAEQAAPKARANPLLCRAAALYHDIGKIKTPLYFAENAIDGNDFHRNISPGMSARIMQSHVTESVELARAQGLGDRLVDIIGQHHGTELMVKFADRAKQKALDDGKSSSEIDTDMFRYQGELPTSKEAGIIMLADQVESACRTLQQPSPEKIHSTVSRVAGSLFRDGQLSDCELTVKDLEAIVETFSAVITEAARRQPAYLGQRPTASTDTHDTQEQRRTPHERVGNQT